MSISFEISNNELLLCYSPDYGIESINKKLSEKRSISIKNTFYVTNELLRESPEGEYDLEETLRFCIGKIGESYTAIDSEVIGTNHQFFFGNEIKLKPEIFFAYRNISILRKIDDVIERDFYVGGDWETNNGIPKELYMELLDKFPKTAELNKYAHKRIANIIKEFYPECDKYEEIYNKFIKSKKTSSLSLKKEDTFDYNNEIELAQFKLIYDELKEMLNSHEGIDEETWQKKIHNILCLLYPKYICSVPKVKFCGIDNNCKIPDFLLVDANGFVDVLEIKKADVRILTKYRDNYSATREISGGVQQIEKYIFCLNSSEKSQQDVKSKLKNKIPEDMELQFVNPQGILLLGRSNDFNEQQKRDFEIVKRQYKHVTDIMTYDDLLFRLKNIVEALKAKAHNK